MATLADIFMGGADTTNNQLEWLFFFIGYEPEWQEKLRDEIVAVHGSGDDDQDDQDFVTTNKMDQTPLTEAFILETLRQDRLLNYYT